MDKKFTDEQIKKALQQADANMNFEEVVLPNIDKSNSKTLRKELKK